MKRFVSYERPRCVGMTEQSQYEDAHQCRYQVDQGHEQDQPPLCNKCLAKLERRLEIRLVDGSLHHR